MQKTGGEFGLIKSSVAGVLAERIEIDEDGEAWFQGWEGEGRFRIKELPEECSSEEWGLPPME